ncbi:hypothetical protein Fmac_029740 [Flemingia macrophylla]|uniref:Uncharacterized protein n=1 Tax=Flemingia macrophylla TaxID=520843 RepID=A0ABD1LB69_9FABA
MPNILSSRKAICITKYTSNRINKESKDFKAYLYHQSTPFSLAFIVIILPLPLILLVLQCEHV